MHYQYNTNREYRLRHARVTPVFRLYHAICNRNRTRPNASNPPKIGATTNVHVLIAMSTPRRIRRATTSPNRQRD